MNKLSVIIPSRSPQYLKKTINDLLAKAEGEVEVIVIFDGRWPTPEEMPEPDKRVILIHQGSIHNSPGMREAINKGVAISKGNYLMKIDEHCAVNSGFDTILMADCEDDWIVIPRRKRLDAENWTLIEDGRPDIDYMYIEYPYLKPFDKTQGLHGSIWKQRTIDLKDELISDTPTMQGSCYFMKKSYWNKLFPNGLDSDKYGNFTGEAQELSFSAWFSGGRVVRNKKTFYAHLHKGHGGKGYCFSNHQYHEHAESMEKGRLFCIDKWVNTKDYKYDFKWFVNEKFPNMPKWPSDWEERIVVDKDKDYSSLKYKDDFWLKNLRT